jgi:sigma-B regulation protein RsbU (phosphoserine phosphatase)
MAGLLGGVIYLLNKKEFPAVWQATLFGAGMELLHMGLVLLIARPFDQALAVVKDVIIPMTGANTMGITIFALIIRNLVVERQTAAEKEKYRRELEHKEFEIETARRIQESFLPESTPRLDGFDLAAVSLPALEVGGDFYDFIPIAQDKWGFVIADVSGKGFPAALFMALSRMCVRANAMGKPNASEAIRIANSLISQDAKSGMFVTMFYALLDLKHKRLNYINAGHNPPLLFQGNAGGVTLLKAKGIALGVLDDVDLEEVWLDLGIDDTVVLYTDGVTEAINKKEEPFGLERLIKLITQNKDLSAQSLVDKIKGEVTAFSQGQSQFDDLTLVVLKAV